MPWIIWEDPIPFWVVLEQTKRKELWGRLQTKHGHGFVLDRGVSPWGRTAVAAHAWLFGRLLHLTAFPLFVPDTRKYQRLMLQRAPLQRFRSQIYKTLTSCCSGISSCWSRDCAWKAVCTGVHEANMFQAMPTLPVTSMWLLSLCYTLEMFYKKSCRQRNTRNH